MNEYTCSRMIAKYIILAKSCSDSGKNLDKGVSRLNKKGHYFGYSLKTDAIIRAINLINMNDTQMYHYWVVAAPDQNGNDSIIVFFDYTLEGKRQQISFHTPMGTAPKALKKMVGKGRKTKHYKKCKSRIAVANLAKFYKLSYG